MRTLTSRCKTFSPKVRTGCTTCKRRRLKCDERKPLCLRCWKSNLVCEGYNIPKAKIFELSPPKTSQQLDVVPLEDDNQNKNDLQIWLSVPTLGTIFRNAEDRNAFQVYVTKTGPMIASYSPQVDFLLTNFTPKMALDFPALKHLLISMGAAHERWLQNKAFDANLPNWALSHYNKSIRDVVQNKLPKLVVFLTALLSFCFELLRYNYTAAAVHIQGVKSIFREIENGGSAGVDRTTQDSISTDIKLARELVEGTFKILQAKKVAQKNDPFAGYGTFQEARDSLVQRLNQFVRSSKSEHDIHEMRTFLTHWINRFRQWDQTLPQFILRDALRLLFLLALSLLPSDQAAGFSHSRNPLVVEYTLKKVSELRQVKGESVETMAALNETLKLVLIYIIRCYNEEDYQEQAASMLTMLSTETP